MQRYPVLRLIQRDTTETTMKNEPLDMQSEEDRLKTYATWPLAFVKPEILARNGFYYLGRGDEVRCAFCKVEIMRWMEGDDPKSDHQRWAPQCPFLKQQSESDDVEIEPGHDECGIQSLNTAHGQIPMPGAVHTQFATESARLSSFKDWPRSMAPKPEELAEAGFFYTGQGDKTKCFYCDGGLKDWEAEDIPWEHHARWFNRCAFLILNKGRDYVQKVITEARAIPAKNNAATSEESVENLFDANKKDGDIDDPKLCKICYKGELNVAFVPCGHVVACAKCALVSNKCPMCRRVYINAVRLYYS